MPKKIVLSLTLKKEGEPLEAETSDLTGNVVPELRRFWAEKPVDPGGSWLEFEMDFPEQRIVFCSVKDLFHGQWEFVVRRRTKRSPGRW